MMRLSTVQTVPLPTHQQKDTGSSNIGRGRAEPRGDCRPQEPQGQGCLSSKPTDRSLVSKALKDVSSIQCKGNVTGEGAEVKNQEHCVKGIIVL